MTSTTTTAPTIATIYVPAWNEGTRVDGEFVDHVFTSPTAVQVATHGLDEEARLITVQLIRADRVIVTREVVGLQAGEDRVYLLDHEFTIAEAGKLVAAIAEALEAAKRQVEIR